MMNINGLVGIGGFVGTSEGQRLVARFCDAVDRGETPSAEDMKAIADGLRPIITNTGTRDTMKAVADGLGVTRRQGKRLSTGAGSLGQVSVMWAYFNRVDDLEANGAPNAERIARYELQEREGISDKAARDRINAYVNGADYEQREKERVNLKEKMDALRKRIEENQQ